MQNALQIEIDRLKYHTIEDLLSDYDFISKPTSENILFLDLNEAGHYYPYSTTKYWKFDHYIHANNLEKGSNIFEAKNIIKSIT